MIIREEEEDNLDEKIISLSGNITTSQQNSTLLESKILYSKVTTSSTELMSTLFEKLNQCKINLCSWRA